MVSEESLSKDMSDGLPFRANVTAELQSAEGAFTCPLRRPPRVSELMEEAPGTWRCLPAIPPPSPPLSTSSTFTSGATGRDGERSCEARCAADTGGPVEEALPNLSLSFLPSWTCCNAGMGMGRMPAGSDLVGRAPSSSPAESESPWNIMACRSGEKNNCSYSTSCSAGREKQKGNQRSRRLRT